MEAMKAMWRSLLNEPRVENPPRRVWRDWVLLAVVLVLLVIELLVRDDINNPAITTPLVIAMAVALLWRRTAPRAVIVSLFGGVVLYDLASIVFGFGSLNIYMPAVMLVAMYAAFRWGSGTDMVIAFGFGIAAFATANTLDYTGLSDLVGGFFILQFGPAIALAIRYVGRSREQARHQIRVDERERIARELHDTVAHHVSAIAIQAQAGRFVAEQGSIDAAADALEVIEEEASRTLAEMRSIVSVLRDADSPVEMAPQAGIDDVARFASATSVPEVVVHVDDDGRTVSPALGAATYRIVQEAITNARRHARNATRVEVRVHVQPRELSLTITDDGDPAATTSTDGFGLIGMSERATMLNGTLTAGPAAPKGWRVQALLPRNDS